ncbi:pentapeptide repeat protein [Blastomonas natatoria]|uniref:Pentapeptide repeat protein n=1 Tax=Blastomonas natatoria TaxID=34015 RepID=A0A2V3VF43_9SPHN|nr:pentapeptide repeat-containing protein [Blastomonas natatoria]PXW75249.1 pentapeptide repeat protein [Blastomonas natatoria]
MLRSLAALCAIWLAVAPASAQASVPCEAMLGDLWGEREGRSDVRQIDGTKLGAPAQLIKAVRQNTVIRGGNFAGWDFRRLSLTNVCFVEADLQRSLWDEARAPGIGFIQSNLAGASLIGIQAPGILLRDANLSDVQATKADFSDGKLEGGWFDGSIDGLVLDNANLSGFDFSCGITLSDGCPLHGSDKPISARGADLTRAKLSTFHRYGLFDIELDGAVLDRTEISPAQLASLKGLLISHPLVLVGGAMRIELTAAEAQALADDVAIADPAVKDPSFDCSTANSAAEKTICLQDSRDLADADRLLARTFAQARKKDSQLVAGQREWLKQRDACMGKEFPTDCLRSAYADRQGQLLGALGERDWLKPGEAALFIDDELPVSDSMRQTALFARLAPLLAQASMGYVHVERSGDGQYIASGESIGANAHSCTLGARGLRLDPMTGWYSVTARGSNRKIRVVQIDGDWLRVFASGHPYGEVAEAEADFASCGARAAFEPMRRIMLPPDVLASYAARAELEP